MDNALSKAVSNYTNSLLFLKEQTIDFINNIEEVPVKRIGNTNNCFVVSSSTIFNNGGILSPFYYNVREQKQQLIDIVNRSQGLGFLQTFAEIAETGKRTVRSKGSSYQQIFSPHVKEAMKNYIEEVNIYVD